MNRVKLKSLLTGLVLLLSANTPLAETLYQVYTYFMSRSSGDRPLGKDGSTTFPEYEYRTTTSSGGPSRSRRPGAARWPAGWSWPRPSSGR